MATLTTTATVAAFFSSTAFIVTASLLAAALIAYLIYALVTGKGIPFAPKVSAEVPASPKLSGGLVNDQAKQPAPSASGNDPQVDPVDGAALGYGQGGSE